MRNSNPNDDLKIELIDEGLRVLEVAPGSSAARAGIEPGDVILRLFNFPIQGQWGQALQRNLRGKCLAHVRNIRDGQVVTAWLDFGNSGAIPA